MRTMDEKLRNCLRLTDELTAQRDAARAEVEHLKRERDALQIRTQESEGAGWKARLRGDKALTERDEARAEAERLRQELATAKRRADEWEYRAGEWMVRAEDAEAQLAAAQANLAKARRDVELERSRRDFLIRAIESASTGEGADAEWLREVAKSARLTHDVAAGPTR